MVIKDTDILISIERVVKDYFESLLDVENMIAELDDSMGKNLEVLTFMTGKANEHSEAAEQDINSIKNLKLVKKML